MFNKKHITTLAALSLSAMLLAGCQESAEPINIVSPAAAGEPSANDTAPVTPDETSTETSIETATSTVIANKTAEPTATVNIKCTLPENAPAQAALYKTKPFWFEDGLPEKLLLNDVDFILEERRVNEAYPDIIQPIYVHAEDRLLGLGYNGGCSGEIFFRRCDEHMYGTLRNLFDVYNVEETIFNDKSLDGFAPEEAVAKADEVLGKLGITNLGTPEVWAIKADKANEVIGREEWNEKDGSVTEWKRWTTDDEVYYLTYPVEYDGIPVALSGPIAGGMTKIHPENGWSLLEGSYIQVTVARDGSILELEGYRIPSADVENVGTVDISVSAQQAADILTEHHAAQDFPAAINVTECSLVYVMTADDYGDEFILKPMWKFEMNYDSNGTYGVEGVVMIEYVEADTGAAYFEY
ncbi:MAG: hypothetical protein HDT43_08155 [Ruminococcaceae bacterium]|nr:hypothetical protein [Oscillospiraceae bacterium]